ncbi:aldehyde dehydrogenase family 7 member A1 [Tremella mesenterica]|uniref:aldehyde dehydrogenase (NAD(+)) n=1 Tax=Tremella mesenterica TaxID=5217 RepID=A0A4Q1BUH0_TREME|nr:aldehyde dehydrogenase family 7 member A1 [Tremella mesenterica]
MLITARSYPILRGRLPQKFHTRHLSARATRVLSALNLPVDGSPLCGVYDNQWRGSGPEVLSRCPAAGEILGRVTTATEEETRNALARTKEASLVVRKMPGPKRGEVIRQMREVLADKVGELGDLVSLEMGKIKSEGRGEVQEFVDICDYATGLSRSMSGRVLSSERPEHVIYEIPNPLGVVGIISAFNFPVRIWPLLSLRGINSTIWKPSITTPLTSVAVTKLLQPVIEANGLPGATISLITGGSETGKQLVSSPLVDLVSFTGSENVGRQVGQDVQGRFGKSILELGGNNAVIVMDDADLQLALRAVLFAAVGTTGQRCTSTRRLLLHRSISQKFLSMLLPLYDSLTIGDPLDPKTLVGPLHTPGSVEMYEGTLSGILDRGGKLLTSRSGRMDEGLWEEGKGGNWVYPVVIRPKKDDPCWSQETFAPILYVNEFDTLEEAIEINNSVPQGLSSSLFTNNLQSMGRWLGPEGSDCGLVNINTGTSGAEISAAFGGNKSTGWGRESGGDAWKQYVSWSSASVNYSNSLPLAQGVNFEVL